MFIANTKMSVDVMMCRHGVAKNRTNGEHGLT